MDKAQFHNPTIAVILHTVVSFCAARSISAWLVGGTVRDLLMGHVAHDLDIAVDTDGVALARTLADTVGGSFVLLDPERGAGRVVWPSPTPPQPNATEPGAIVVDVDLVQLRAPTLLEDLELRDLTINALAIPLVTASTPATHHDLPAWLQQPGEHLPSPQELDIVDPCGGQRDIAAHHLHLCRPSSLRDDPLRILRTVRLAATLGFHISPPLDAAIRHDAPLLAHVAAERVRDELLKLLAAPHAAPWLHYLDEVGVLTLLIPELEPARTCDQPIFHFLPVLGHMLETVTALEWLLADKANGYTPRTPPPTAVQTHPHLPRTFAYREQVQHHMATTMSDGHPRGALLKLAALLHDNAKPQTKQPKPGGGVTFHEHQKIGATVASGVARRLRLSRQNVDYVARVVRNHMRPGQLQTEERVTPRAIARFFRDTGDAGVDVLLHGLADSMAASGPQIKPEHWQHQLEWTAMMLDTYWNQPPERKKSLLNGYDLMHELGLEPGKLVGTLLNEIREAQAAGEISTREEALHLARQMVGE
jgi:poly(A) polymerase/tRNA nucleotidyltransferase (CCA-adding enzyme)